MSDEAPGRAARIVPRLVFPVAALALIFLGLYGLGQWFQLSSDSEATLRSQHGSAVMIATVIGFVVLVAGTIMLRGSDDVLVPTLVVAAVAVAIPGAMALRAQRATGPDPVTSREMDRFEPPAGLRDPRTESDPAERSMERVWTADRTTAEACKDVEAAMARWGEKPGPLRPLKDGIGDCEYRLVHGDRVGSVWVGVAGVKPNEYVIVNLTVQPCEPERSTRCKTLSA